MSKRGAWKGEDFSQAPRWGKGVPMGTDSATGQCNNLQLMVSECGQIGSPGGKIEKGFGVRTKDLLLVLTGNLGHCPCISFYFWRQSSSLINFQEKTTYAEKLMCFVKAQQRMNVRFVQHHHLHTWSFLQLQLLGGAGVEMQSQDSS